MELKKINYKNIQDGDIIYVTLNSESNDLFLGEDEDLTGTDIIAIIDDSALGCHGSFLINGGHCIFINPDDAVYKIGHYSKLLKKINN